MKLYIIVRNDLPSKGAYVAQSVHAVIELLIQGKIDILLRIWKWYKKSNTVICLWTTPDQCLSLYRQAYYRGYCMGSLFFEPDLDQYTGFACICDSVEALLFSEESLTLKEDEN